MKNGQNGSQPILSVFLPITIDTMLNKKRSVKRSNNKWATKRQVWTELKGDQYGKINKYLHIILFNSPCTWTVDNYRKMNMQPHIVLFRSPCTCKDDQYGVMNRYSHIILFNMWLLVWLCGEDLLASLKWKTPFKFWTIQSEGIRFRCNGVFTLPDRQKMGCIELLPDRHRFNWVTYTFCRYRCRAVWTHHKKVKDQEKQNKRQTWKKVFPWCELGLTIQWYCRYSVTMSIFETCFLHFFNVQN